MYVFNLRDASNQEIFLSLNSSEEFLIQFDIDDQEICLSEVLAGEHEILAILSDEMITSIEEQVFSKLKEIDGENYADAMLDFAA